MAYRDSVLSIAGQPEMWFEFDGNLNGSGYSGGATALTQVAGSIDAYGEGIPAGSTAAYFDGNERLRSSGTYTNQMASTNAAWIKTDATNTTMTVWNFNTSSGSTSAGSYLRMDLISGSARMRGGSSAVYSNSGSADLRDGNWHFLVWKRWPNYNAQIWIDGVHMVTTFDQYMLVNINGHLWVGDNGHASYGAFYKGWMSHVMYWPFTLSDQQVIDLYNAGMTPPPPPSTAFRGWGIPV